MKLNSSRNMSSNAWNNDYFKTQPLNRSKKVKLSQKTGQCKFCKKPINPKFYKCYQCNIAGVS